jgi:dihydroflavonol-4-reductase
LIIFSGGSGYIAGHIIELLLQKGYQVRAIVRDLSNEDKIAHLKKLPQKDGQLTFKSAKIEDGAYGEVLKGAHVLIHTATPYIYTAPDPQRDIVDPAIKGTVDAINAAIDNGLKRVVICSSGGAAMSIPIPPNAVVTPKDWNETSSLTNNPYFLSKKLSEQAAWKLWEEKKDKIDLAVVNPFFVLGPIKSTSLNQSVARIKGYLSGDKSGLLPGKVGIVDVRDVAAAFVIAAEHPDAVGKRIFACGSVNPWKSIADYLKAQYPQYPVVDTAGVSEGSDVHIDTSILKSLGHSNFIPFQQTLKDTVDSLIALGVVENKQK